MDAGERLYKFLVVDDELIIRDALTNHIPWEDLGFTFCGACADGNAALDKIEQEAPDVVMTDICMPFLDGIALTELITERYPMTKVILLTGYDDFEYAQAAVKLKVYDFLLKPITPRELRKVLLSVKEKLDEEYKSRKDIESLKTQLNESLPILRERILNMLLTGTQRKEELGNRLTYLGLSFPLNGFFYLVMAIAIDSRAEDEEYELNLLAAKNGVEKILSSEFKSISFQDGGDRLIVLAWHERQDMIFRDSLLEAEEINRKLPAYLTASVTLGIGEPVPDVSLIPRSYSDAMKALSFGTIQGGGRIVTYRELIGKTNDARKVPLNWGKLIANALRSSSRDEVFSHIDNLIASYREGYFSVEEYHVSLQMTLAAILQAVEDFDIPQHDIIPAGTDPFSEVRSKTSLEEVREWFISICGRIMDSLKTRQEDFSKAKIREAKAYIETQFSDPSLSLQTVCKELSISTSYFSLIFKKYLKKTFVEYLTETRVEKAKEFLRNTNMKTYDIARSIGYRDAHYFSLIFRKATGEPPTAYRTKSRDESA